MKVVVMTATNESFEKNDYRGFLKITIDGKERFLVWDGELEDNNLGRNFHACYRIANLLEEAYSAGKNGEDFSMEKSEIESLEEFYF